MLTETLTENARQGANYVASGVEQCVESHPLTTIVTSALGGFCIGLLVTRLLESAATTEPSTMERFGRSVADSFSGIVPERFRR